MYRTWIEIHEQSLTSNIQTLKELVSEGSVFCPVLKANAYGHGMKEVARIAKRNGVNAFAVDSIDEAIVLRDLFPTSLLLVLGYTISDRFLEAIQAKINLTMYDLEGLRELELIASKSSLCAKVHLKIDTGLTRQGVLPDDLTDILTCFNQSPHLELVGVSSHFANIEDTLNPEFATIQFERFQQNIKHIISKGFQPEYIHCTCSAATILYPQTHGTLVRSGISLYGIYPSTNVEETIKRQSITCVLKPVLTWKTRIAQIKTISSGTPIGYGLTETVNKQSRIAILPVGYWDGYDRGLSSKGEVLVSGYRCKVMGRVCMNMMMINISDVPNVQKNQEAILIGKDTRNILKAEFLAEKIQTNVYEVLTRINPLLPRIIV